MNCISIVRKKAGCCREELRSGGEGDDRGRDGGRTSPTPWPRAWASTWRRRRPGKPGVLQSTGSQRPTQLSGWTTQGKGQKGFLSGWDWEFPERQRVGHPHAGQGRSSNRGKEYEIGLKGDFYIHLHAQSLNRVRLFGTPWAIVSARPLWPWNFPGNNTGVGCHFQPSQGSGLDWDSNPSLLCLLHWQAVFHLLNHPGSCFYFHKQQPLGRKAEPKWAWNYDFNRFINHKITFTLDVKANYKATVIKSMMLASGEEKKQRTKERKGEGGKLW